MAEKQEFASGDADGKKKENCYFPFVAQSGYERCVFKSFKIVYI